MNTFLTAVMVDILEPVAAATGLGENVARARQNLSEQIEANGLVRYSGRPDGPTIPFLGGVTTPDADDSALAWRIAGQGKEALLPGALAILKSYRTRQGLYRTWLAPRNQYVNIDPGQDPNPVDVTIQMHILMFLAKYDAAAARALYETLQRNLGDERIWVYYKMTPLLPMLRAGELSRLGYPLQIPPIRVEHLVRGQAIWAETCRRLAVPLAETEPSDSGIPALLRTLAQGDFSAIRDNPPLLYHNDLTASVRRFYWSEDFGYALWLRLFWENSVHSDVTTPKR
jgi:hypothetical protein